MRSLLWGFAALCDAPTVIALAALGAIWYGIQYAEPAWWIVGAAVYVPLVVNLMRSGRSQ